MAKKTTNEASASRGAGWRNLLDCLTADDDATLVGALFTTYDRPDATLLAERLLPRCLGVDGAADGDDGDRRRFLFHVARALHRVPRDPPGISVFSSPCRDDEPGHWVWGAVRRFTTGRNGQQVQHAKLWLVHRASGRTGQEWLDIVVSSANLTAAGLDGRQTGQLQAAWHARVPLERAAHADGGGWGVLPAFLRALGTASGEGGAAVCEAWVSRVLPRGRCPEGVTFVASVPGVHDGRWGMAGLPAVKRARGALRIFVPTVGYWDAEGLRAFAARAGVAAKSMSLLWIDQAHPWAGAWQMPAQTLDALGRVGASVKRLPASLENGASRVHPEQRGADNRWSHAKAYGWADRVLVTSANFSPSAWGRPTPKGLAIENFELGVLVDRAAWPEALDGAPLARGQAATCELCNDPDGGDPPTWAEAGWDGDGIDVQWCPGDRPPARRADVAVEAAPAATLNGIRWTRAQDVRRTRLAWSAERGRPRTIALYAGDTRLVEVPIADFRPATIDVEPVFAPEVTGDDAEALDLALLEARYDGPEPEVPGRGTGRASASGRTNAPPVSYGVASLQKARERLRVVDAWAATLDRAPHSLRPIVLGDGRRLVALWRARLACSHTEDAVTSGLRVAIREIEARLQEATS